MLLKTVLTLCLLSTLAFAQEPGNDSPQPSRNAFQNTPQNGPQNTPQNQAQFLAGLPVRGTALEPLAQS